MSTYSLGITAATATSVAQVKNHVVDDTVALPGGMAQAMRLGTVFQAKGPDGMSRNYVYDAERSTLANPILRRV